jgi:8-oxo-dGTP diphosphatase
MTEADFLRDYDPTAYERPSVAVDLVLLGIREGRPAVLLLQRAEHPFAGRWALPGGFVGIDEALDAAAVRVLHEKAGIGSAHCEQLYTFGAVDRDPRMRIITVAWLALLTEDAFAAALAANPKLIPAAIDVPWAGEAGGEVRPLSPEGDALPIAFDHADILALAIQRLRGKLDYSEVGFALLPDRFTLRQLQDVHEAILGTTLNKPAFRRRMQDKGWLGPTGAREEGTSYRPAELFRFQRPL